MLKLDKILKRKVEFENKDRNGKIQAILNREIKKKDKEENMIAIKNIIIRKSRHAMLSSHIVLMKSLIILNAHLEKRRGEILQRFQLRMAVSRLGRAIKDWLGRDPDSVRSKVRFGMTAVVGAKMATERIQRHCRDKVRIFLFVSSKKFYMYLKFKKLFEKVIHV